MKPILTITFGPTADDITIEAVNTQGSSCVTNTQPYEAALGGTPKRVLKPEFSHQALASVATVTHRGSR